MTILSYRNLDVVVFQVLNYRLHWTNVILNDRGKKNFGNRGEFLDQIIDIISYMVRGEFFALFKQVELVFRAWTFSDNRRVMIDNEVDLFVHVQW